MADKLKVLVLDDERLVRFTISAYLQGAEFDVATAGTPEEAIGLVKRGRFHAIVSDVMMGETDGFMFRSLVREVDADVPIIFLTSMMNDAGNAFMEKVMEDVRSYYVAKSAPRTVLVARLRQVVKAHLAELNVRKMERHLERDLSLASCVQKAMLPPWAHIDERYAFTVCFAPHQEVSGDLFEWFPVGAGKALFIAGDIAGHGTTASLAMTAVQAFLKQFSGLDERRAKNLSRIASRVHEFLCTNLHEVAYMVASFVYVDFNEWRVRYLNCGNPELEVYSRFTGKSRTVNPDHRGTLPLGLMDDAAFTEEDMVEFNLSPDEVMMLFSDGIYDLSSDADGLKAVPRELVSDVISMAVRAAGVLNGAYSAIPHRILAAMADMGYSRRQDDVSFAVIGSISSIPDRYTREIKMSPPVIDEACRQIAEWVGSQYGDEVAVRVDLLLNEHLMNVHRHGLDDFGREHEVTVVSVTSSDNSLEVAVWDRGSPWQNVAEASDEKADRVLDARNAGLADGGRGLSIVRKVSDAIAVERFFNLNKTVFRLNATRTAPPPAKPPITAYARPGEKVIR